jgi:hypothetical protein
MVHAAAKGVEIAVLALAAAEGHMNVETQRLQLGRFFIGRFVE